MTSAYYKAKLLRAAGYPLFMARYLILIKRI